MSRPSATTAAAVSSQELSIPSTFIVNFLWPPTAQNGAAPEAGYSAKRSRSIYLLSPKDPRGLSSTTPTKALSSLSTINGATPPWRGAFVDLPGGADHLASCHPDCILEEHAVSAGKPSSLQTLSTARRYPDATRSTPDASRKYLDLGRIPDYDGKADICSAHARCRELVSDAPRVFPWLPRTTTSAASTTSAFP